MSKSTRPYCEYCKKFGHKEETCWNKLTSNMSQEELEMSPNEEEFNSFQQAMKELKEEYGEKKREIFKKHAKELEKSNKGSIATRNQPYRTARIATYLKQQRKKLEKEAKSMDRSIMELEGLKR